MMGKKFPLKKDITCMDVVVLPKKQQLNEIYLHSPFKSQERREIKRKREP
jgi:hypothetical protein